MGKAIAGIILAKKYVYKFGLSHGFSFACSLSLSNSSSLQRKKHPCFNFSLNLGLMHIC